MLATKLSRHGVHISLADKLPRYGGSTLLRQIREEKEKNEGKKDGGVGGAGDGMYL